ncbi:MAG: FHA domain-containing protein [Desulfobacteraceae bacterium]|nr:FHA domain-containing protein [Desulfobacteraceae bacterium]
MITLTLIYGKKELKKFALKKGEALTVGRKNTNNVTIDNVAVSGTHAEILYLDKGLLVTDLNSKNGTFVNRKKINAHWLQNHDKISICKHTLVVSNLQTQKPGHAAQESDPTVIGSGLYNDETMILDTNTQKSLIEQNRTKTRIRLNKKKKSLGVLIFLSGGTGKLELTNRIIKIGKSDTCDIIVRGFFIGKTMATIVKRPDGYYFSYYQGFIKPKINNRPVTGSVKLKAHDKIKAGSAVLEFYFK